MTKIAKCRYPSDMEFNVRTLGLVLKVSYLDSYAAIITTNPGVDFAFCLRILVTYQRMVVQNLV